jgi:glc operon protein GlcG
VNLRLLSLPGITAVDGGIPLLSEGKIVGAIGVSGLLPQQDAQVAAAGAAAFHRL